MKAIIFDAGPLINLTMNGLLYILPELKKLCNGKLIITEAVKKEVVDHPIKIKRFEFEALQIQGLLQKGVLELPEAIGVSSETIQKNTQLMLDKANHFLQVNGQWIQIVSEAEISCLSLNDECTKKGIDSIIAIDERTTRLMAEKPEALAQLMSERLHKRVSIGSSDYKVFSKYKFIRSSELVFVAYKKGILSIKGKDVLEAALYATKFKGSSISFEEIDELKKL